MQPVAIKILPSYLPRVSYKPLRSIIVRPEDERCYEETTLLYLKVEWIKRGKGSLRVCKNARRCREWDNQLLMIWVGIPIDSCYMLFSGWIGRTPSYPILFQLKTQYQYKYATEDKGNKKNGRKTMFLS